MQLVADAVADAAEVAHRRQARDAERDLGRALAERPPERVADDHADVAARPLADRLPDPRSRGIGIEREQDERPLPLRVRGVDAGRRADVAVPRLGDDQRRPHADDVGALAEDPLDVTGIAVVGELERPLRRLDVVQPHDAALRLRDRLLRDDEHVRVLEAARLLGRVQEQPREVVAVLDLRDALERDHPDLARGHGMPEMRRPAWAL